MIRRLRAKGILSRAVVITGRFDHALPAELLALGVAGYVEKTWLLEESLKTVEHVLAGGIRLARRTSPPPQVLTTREREIARLAARGEISKEIAIGSA